MNNLKRLTLLALLAVAVTAAMGAASSPAQAKICSTQGQHDSCGGGHGWVYSGLILEELTPGKPFLLTSGFITVSCSQATREVEVNGATSTGSVTKESFSGCTNNINGGACTMSSSASALNKWPLKATTGTAPDGTNTISNMTISFTCNVFGSPTTCNYVASDAVEKVEGGHTAETIETSVIVSKEAGSGALCSNTATRTAYWHILYPESLFYT